MKERLQGQTEKHASQLSAKDEAVIRLQDQLTHSKQQETESRQELDTLRELTALSHAYSSLEEEYRRASEGKHTTQTPGGEIGEMLREQAEGEGSQQVSGSTEVATLRAANARLRKDNKAAEEWMDMAGCGGMDGHGRRKDD